MDNNLKASTLSPKVWALVILAAGLVAVGGSYAIIKNREIPKSYVTTQGQVASSPGISRGNYELHITFTAKDNKQYAFTNRIPVTQTAKSSTTPYPGEKTVKVAYNPQNPGAHPINASDKDTPFYAIVVAIVGGLFAILGFISIVYQLVTRR